MRAPGVQMATPDKHAARTSTIVPYRARAYPGYPGYPGYATLARRMVTSRMHAFTGLWKAVNIKPEPRAPCGHGVTEPGHIGAVVFVLVA